MGRVIKILFITPDKGLQEVLEFCFRGWGYDVFFESPGSTDLSQIIRINPDVIVLDVSQASKEELEICDLLKDDFATAYVPIITLIPKRNLRQKLLKLREGVDDYLVKPPDPFDLRIRIEMALKRSQHTFNASPLTGLPGSVVVENELRERIERKESFVLGHVDIDNFKCFNDKYGYMNGDRVIMQTAHMLSTSVRCWGTSGDFVGHIGGDDFVIIADPDKYKEICQNFICMFDTVTPFYYSIEDRVNGYIRQKDRTGRTRNIPLMSVTIALVVKNNPAELNHIIELNERVAEVKEYLKKLPGSKYMADRRIVHNEDHLTLQMFTNDESLVHTYRPLGQILLEQEVITVEQLNNALKAHWKNGEPLGQVLKESGALSEEQLEEALVYQENGFERVS